MADSAAQNISHKKSWLVPLMCLLGGGSLLGLSINLAKLAGEKQLAPATFLFWSLAGAALLLTCIAILRKDPPPHSARALEYYVVAAVVGVAGPNLIFFSAIPHLGAGFVAMLGTLPPLLTYVGALALRMEQFQTLRAVGVASALAGAMALAAGKLSAPNADTFWIVLTLLAPLLLAIGNLYRSLRWPPGVAADALAPGMLLAAASLLLMIGLLPGSSLAVPTEQSLPVILIVVQALVFAGQFLLLLILQKTGGPVLLSLLGAVGAAFGVPVAIYLQGETPPEGLLAGVILIGTGVALLTLSRIRR